MTSDIKPLFEGIRLAGTAVTVKTIASDLAAAFKAIDLCKPGDVVVIDSPGSANTVFWGENITLSAINRGVCAAVIDGACRDVVGDPQDQIPRNLQRIRSEYWIYFRLR